MGFDRRLRFVALAAVVAAGNARAAGTLTEAISAGAPIIDLRLRLEDVDQANKAKTAVATTLRARLGYQTGEFEGFSALAEFDAVPSVLDRHATSSCSMRRRTCSTALGGLYESSYEIKLTLRPATPP
jgi:hypothetical protein